jgi:membrane dipeptidase
MNIPILDGHNDSLSRLYPYTRKKVMGFFDSSSEGQLDLPRACMGGLAGGLFSLYVSSNPSWMKPPETEVFLQPDVSEALPGEPLDPIYAQQATNDILAGIFRIETASQGQVKVVRTVADLTTCMHNGILAVILHFEGAEAIDQQLNALEVYYQAGLRSIGVVWSRPNCFGSGVPFRHPSTPDTGPGLTDAGRELVRECNRLGVMLDVSHLNEQGFWDLAALTDAPIVATHSAVHAICPSARNLTDKQLDAIRESDGMVGTNFEVSTLRPDGGNDPDTPLDVLVSHIDYLVDRLGIDRVGFGSDFDGGTMPRDLRDVTGLSRLISLLQQHGYDEDSLSKLAYKNWLRVLQLTWRTV